MANSVINDYGLDVLIRTYSHSVDVPAESNMTVTANDLGMTPISGYTAVALQSIATGNGNIYFRQFNPSAVGTNAVVMLHNVINGVATSNLTIKVVYIRTSRIQT